MDRQPLGEPTDSTDSSGKLFVMVHVRVGDGCLDVLQELLGYTSGGYGIQLVLESKRLPLQEGCHPLVALQWLSRCAKDRGEFANVQGLVRVTAALRDRRHILHPRLYLEKVVQLAMLAAQVLLDVVLDADSLDFVRLTNKRRRPISRPHSQGPDKQEAVTRGGIIHVTAP